MQILNNVYDLFAARDFETKMLTGIKVNTVQYPLIFVTINYVVCQTMKVTLLLFGKNLSFIIC